MLTTAIARAGRLLRAWTAAMIMLAIMAAPVVELAKAVEPSVVPTTFTDNSQFTTSPLVVSGSGTEEDPYLIADHDFATLAGPANPVLLVADNIGDARAVLEFRGTSAHVLVTRNTFSRLNPSPDITDGTASGTIRGILVDQAKNIQIVDNAFDGVGYPAIAVRGASGVNITGNSIHSLAGPAIEVESSQVTIAGNEIAGMGTGIILREATSGSIVETNTIEVESIGIRVDHSNRTIVRANSITISGAGYAFHVSYTTGTEVMRNHFHGGAYCFIIAFSDGIWRDNAGTACGGVGYPASWPSVDLDTSNTIDGAPILDLVGRHDTAIAGPSTIAWLRIAGGQNITVADVSILGDIDAWNVSDLIIERVVAKDIAASKSSSRFLHLRADTIDAHGAAPELRDVRAANARIRITGGPATVENSTFVNGLWFIQSPGTSVSVEHSIVGRGPATADGLVFAGQGGSTPTIRNSTIEYVAAAGITADARLNWWGSPSGPRGPGEPNRPDRQIDFDSGTVYWWPYLTSPPAAGASG